MPKPEDTYEVMMVVQKNGTKELMTIRYPGMRMVDAVTLEAAMANAACRLGYEACKAMNSDPQKMAALAEMLGIKGK